MSDQELVHMNNKPCVAVVFTGGTISMRFDPAAGGAVPVLSGREILAQVPGLENIAEVITTDFARMPGPHMTPAKMFELAKCVRKQLENPQVRGAVVTHGTDTLEETAYMTDLLINSDKPIVFVGAMRNSSELGWDGPANLRSAIRVAIEPTATSLGTLVMFNEKFFAADEAIKMQSDSLGTFQSRDFGPLGIVDQDKVIVKHRRMERNFISATRVEEHVEIIKLSAGSDGKLLRHAIEDGAKGIVIEGLGRGNVPITALEEVKRAAASGIPIVITSRCPGGRVLDTYAYTGAGKQLKEMGVVLGGMIPSHKARIQLMLWLGAGIGTQKIRKMFVGD
jgi:L-asparaginase